jgi:hypothetical protein
VAPDVLERDDVIPGFRDERRAVTAARSGEDSLRGFLRLERARFRRRGTRSL